MNLLREFDVEFIKLKDGQHHFNYVLDDSFFEKMKSSLSSQEIKIELEFIKSPSMFTLNFDIQGHINTQCDRCLADITLPISGQNTLIVKVTEQQLEDQDDLIYINPGEYKINIAQHLYDYVHLLIPIKKTCENIEKNCDPEITKKITMLFDVDTNSDFYPERDTDENEEEED